MDRDKHEIVIRLTGDSGDGMQLVGEQLKIIATLNGKEVRTLPDYPAEIRAPAGTLGGVSGFQLAIADVQIFTAGEELDVLVALNPAALKQAVSYLKPGGLIIINEEAFTPKDYQKAQVAENILETLCAHHQIIAVPLISQTVSALEGINVTHAEAKKAKNFYILGLVLWLFDLPIEACETFIKRKFLKPEIALANIKALQTGFNYAMTVELSRQGYQLGEITREAGEYRHVSGIDALTMALATLTVKTGTPMLVAGYPITPASGILQACAKLKPFGIDLFQAEDEIAAICACLGASYGGRLALTCTSGPGLDLKSEALGLGVMTELPMVLVDVQRAGASTGLPTKTGQSDLLQALYGRHGEAPMPVIAAKSPGDCFQTLLDAFYIAVKYMTPVTVLMDAYLANASEPWKIPDAEDCLVPEIIFNRHPKPFTRDEHLARSWNVPGEGGHVYQVGGLEKEGELGKVSYDADNYQHMVKLRAQKIANIQADIAPVEIEGCKQASKVVVTWGSTYNVMKALFSQYPTVDIAWIHLKHLNPLPSDLGGILKQYKNVLVAELNTGHLCQVIRANYLVDAKSISACTGMPFTVSQLYEAITS